MSDVSQAFSNLAQHPNQAGTTGLFRRWAVWAAVLLSLALWNPNLFSRMVNPFLPVFGRLGGSSYHLDSFGARENLVVFSVTSRVLRDMRDNRGEPGPDIAISGTLPAFMLNLYPVLVFSIALALAGGSLGRRALVTLGLAALLTPLAAAADAWINILVASAKALSQQWPQIAVLFPHSPENAEAFGRIQRSFDRFTEIKAALNAGGRMFLALLIGLIAALPLLLRPDRRIAGPAQDPAPPS